MSHVNEFAIHKALYDYLDANAALTVKSSLQDYSAQTEDFIKASKVPTTTETPIGSGSDVQRGFFDLQVNTKASNSEFSHHANVDGLIGIFTKGIADGIAAMGQKVSISTITPSSTQQIDGWFKTNLTIDYTVVAQYT